MNSIEETIRKAGAEEVAAYLVAAIKRVGELGLEAGQAYNEQATELAGDPHFEEGLAQINA